MSIEIIDAKPCIKCGTLTLSVLEIHDSMGKIYERFTCPPCRDPALARYLGLQAKYKELIAEGMSRQLANEVIIRWYVDNPFTPELRS